MKDKKLHFVYNYLARNNFRIDVDSELAEGDHTILYEFAVTGEGEPMKGKGAPGTGTLFVDGTKVGSVDMDVTVPFLFSIEGISVGMDYGDSVDHANYKPTFPFTGTVKEVRFDLTAEAIQNADVETMHGMSKQ